MDVVYNPLTTRLVREARARGIPAENGLYMLVAQAVLAAEDFTGEPFGGGVTERIYRELCFEKRSIVLTGMPGSGKSTLGALLAEKLGRTLSDTDAEIVRRAGTPITEIFQRHGEAYFRDLESAVIRDLSARGGAVIATGGGAVTRPENYPLLHQNGILIWLRCDPAALDISSKPLFHRPDLAVLYEERKDLYEAFADCVVDDPHAPHHILAALRTAGFLPPEN